MAPWLSRTALAAGAVALVCATASAQTRLGRAAATLTARSPVPTRELTPVRMDARFTLTEVLRIGSEDGGPDAFGRVADAVFGPGGKVYVADDQNHRVAVFDARGRFVGQVGRRGRGPGELESPWRVAVDARDSLFVWDAAQARVSVFGPELAFRRSFQVPAEWVVNGFEFLPDGRLLLAAYARGRGGSMHVLERGGRIVSSFGPSFPATDLAGFESSLLGGSLELADGALAYSKKSPYEVSFFNPDLTSRLTCRGDAKLTTEPRSVVVRTRQGDGLEWNRYAHSASILALGDGKYLNVIRDPVNERRVLDVIDDQCHLYRRTVLDIPLTLTRSQGNRLLGVRTLDYPEVVVYEYRLQTSPAARGGR